MDEVNNEPSGEFYDWRQTGKPERAWLLPYHQTVVMKLFLAIEEKYDKAWSITPLQNGRCARSRVVNGTRVYLTFAEALDVIRTRDNITLGVPKIVYLVGWQHAGHDSKYPDWSEVNPHLKRPEDRTSVESLRWLIPPSRKRPPSARSTATGGTRGWM